MTNLKKHFSDITSLFKYQEKSLGKILSKKNTLTIAPTGGGKSLIFQLAALECEGTAIIVSPLKALMDEQIVDLNKRCIPSLLINSDLPFCEQRKIMRNLRQLNPKLIYVSPERLSNYFFKSALRLSGLKISLVVIDEAHCISQWGIDFRPDYSNIKPFINYLNSFGQFPIVVALTATLGGKARNEIKIEFGINEDDEVISKGVIRDNIILNFTKVENEKAKWESLLSFINAHKLNKVIVYLYSKKKCEEFSEQLPSSDFYHAGMSPERKKTVMQSFKKGDIKVLFATTAFGMGINIPDIDGVIHYQIPRSVEEYYQHVGRGARDKELCPKCMCLLLWSDTNFDREIKKIKKETLTQEDIKKGFCHLGLENKKNKKSYIKWEEIYNNDGTYGSVNLSLILSYLIKYGVCKVAGDIYGNPKDIIFKNNTKLWDNVLQQIGNRNQFIIAEKKTGINLEELIDHVYEQELIGNIDKLPATDRIIFLESNFDSINEEVVDAMIIESKKVEAFKLAQLQQLQELCACDSNNAHNYIANILGVPNK